MLVRSILHLFPIFLQLNIVASSQLHVFSSVFHNLPLLTFVFISSHFLTKNKDIESSYVKNPPSQDNL